MRTVSSGEHFGSSGVFLKFEVKLSELYSGKGLVDSPLAKDWLGLPYPTC